MQNQHRDQVRHLFDDIFRVARPLIAWHCEVHAREVLVKCKGNERLQRRVLQIEIETGIHDIDEIVESLERAQDRIPDVLLDYLLPFNGFLPQVCRRFRWHWSEAERRQAAYEERFYRALTPQLWDVLAEANPAIYLATSAFYRGERNGNWWHDRQPDDIRRLGEEHRRLGEEHRRLGDATVWAVNYNILRIRY